MGQRPDRRPGKSEQRRANAALARSSFRQRELYFLLGLGIGLVVCTWLLDMAFSAANRGYAGRDHGKVLVAGNIDWLAIALCIAFCLLILAFEPLYVRLLHPVPEAATAGYSIVTNFRLTPTVNWVYRMGLLTFLLIALLNLRKYAVITESSILIQSALAFAPERHDCSDISQIGLYRYFIAGVRGRPGSVSADRSLMVSFPDGTYWSPKQSGLSITEATSEEVAKRLGDGCRLTVAYYPQGIIGLTIR